MQKSENETRHKFGRRIAIYGNSEMEICTTSNFHFFSQISYAIDREFIPNE